MASENIRKWAIIPEPNSMTVGEGTVLLPYAGRVNESIAIGDGDFLLAHQLVADIRSATGTDWDIATGEYVVGRSSDCVLRIRGISIRRMAVPPAHTR